MANDRDDFRAAYIRRLVAHRVPELSADEIATAFADPDANASVLAAIADCVTDAIEALEQRLDVLERGLPGRVH